MLDPPADSQNRRCWLFTDSTGGGIQELGSLGVEAGELLWGWVPLKGSPSEADCSLIVLRNEFLPQQSDLVRDLDLQRTLLTVKPSLQLTGPQVQAQRGHAVALTTESECVVSNGSPNGKQSHMVRSRILYTRKVAPCTPSKTMLLAS